MAGFSIKVEGLDELRRGLRNIDESLGKEVGKVNKVVGTKVVAWSQMQRSQMSARFGSYGARVVKAKPSANQRRAMVSVTPAAAEFGTTRHPVFGRWMSQAEFVRRVWPDPNPEGWLIGPTVDDHDTEIADEYLDAVAALAHRVIGV